MQIVHILVSEDLKCNVVADLPFALFVLFYIIYCIDIRHGILNASTIPQISHYENTPMQYTEIFSEAEIENFIGKKKFFFLLNMYPRCMFWIKNKQTRYTPANSSFSI